MATICQTRAYLRYWQFAQSLVRSILRKRKACLRLVCCPMFLLVWCIVPALSSFNEDHTDVKGRDVCELQERHNLHSLLSNQ
jgi:hypothetical protein